MGCSSSSTQTIAQETRPGFKEEMSGETLFSRNGITAEDSLTITEQVQFELVSGPKVTGVLESIEVEKVQDEAFKPVSAPVEEMNPAEVLSASSLHYSAEELLIRAASTENARSADKEPTSGPETASEHTQVKSVSLPKPRLMELTSVLKYTSEVQTLDSERTLAERTTAPEATTDAEPTFVKLTAVEPGSALELTSADSTTALEPTPVELSSALEPTSADCTTALEPTPVEPSSALEPTSANCTTSLEPTPVEPSSALEPTSADCTTALEPTPVEPSSALEPTSADCSTALEPTPVEPSSALEPTSANCTTALESTPMEPSSALETTSADSTTALEPSPVEPSSTPTVCCRQAEDSSLCVDTAVVTQSVGGNALAQPDALQGPVLEVLQPDDDEKTVTDAVAGED